MIDQIELLMLEHFRHIPFHNLSLLYGEPCENKILGGTCSDKTLAFLADVRDRGVDAHLHTAYIGGTEIHRLVRVQINARSFYADIGNGWPALKLFPMDEEISFECFGMKYRTEITNGWVRVFHEKQGMESPQMSINNTKRSETEILEQIRSRYTSGINYPFSNSLRFSLIVGNEFLFLRGNRLERYSDSGFSVQELNEQGIPHIIQKEFGFDVSFYFEEHAAG
ncbi:arylamine N-acetyltransferase [Shewanella inventionis]|uniref:arylamine N-acetyltransferase n=1 Tax=Shewanella inventionis TaxID=1738770 RepID=UPI001CBC2EFF|nr:arylamine N-acetyltransferase [Shewanella inventionis]UAL43672.1 arylamine N-acetyltransferase [Shewanella inventionis]